MTKDLFDKYIWLVDTIHRAGRITLDGINDRWLRSKFSEGDRIPLRTFHNWRKAIEQVFDIIIECDTVNNLINESHYLKRRILFEDIPSGRQYLTPVIEAMRDSVEIRIVHQSFWRNAPEGYTVRPYCVKVFKQRWYVVGYCIEREAMRIFSLDRIISLEVSATRFVYPKDFDPEAYFADSYGITVADMPAETIRIKVFGANSKYVRALPLHHSQCEVETCDDYAVFEYRMIPTFELKQEILSRGQFMEVLSPQSFRDEIAREINRMAANYGLGSGQ